MDTPHGRTKRVVSMQKVVVYPNNYIYIRGYIPID